MKIKGIIALFLTFSFAGHVWAEVPKLLYPSKEEQVKMLNEADDFIDDMADGMQDIQADAVYHSLRGMSGELVNLRKTRDASHESIKGVSHQNLKGDGSARGISMRLYKPVKKSEKPLPLLVYFHGGGWTIGGLNSCQHFCESLVADGGIMVLAVDYRLAPETPFPGGLEDCEASIEYALAHATEWGSSSGLVSVGGDSAGGNLALAATMYLYKKEEMKGKVRSIVLIYPVVKGYNDKSESWKEYSKGYGLDGRLMEAFNEAYLFEVKSVDAKQEPLVSPFHASDKELKELPPVLMLSAERDILYDQGKEFAARLQKIGKSAERIEFPGAVHLFATVAGQPTALRKAVMLTSAFLRK